MSWHLCHVPSVNYSMSRFMRPMSLLTSNNDHSRRTSPSNFLIIHSRLIHRGWLQKKKYLNQNLRIKVKLCDWRLKLVKRPSDVSQLHGQTDRHIHTPTWQLYDQPGPEGRVSEKEGSRHEVQWPLIMFWISSLTRKKRKKILSNNF